MYTALNVAIVYQNLSEEKIKDFDAPAESEQKAAVKDLRVWRLAPMA